jgi:hypothetical protein
VLDASYNDPDFKIARKALVSGLEKLIFENWGNYCSNSTFQGMIKAYRETLPADDQGSPFEEGGNNNERWGLVQSWLQNLAEDGAYLTQDELQFLAAANGIDLTVFNGTFAPDGRGFLSAPQVSSANIQALVDISGCPSAKVLMHNTYPIPEGYDFLAGNHFSVMTDRSASPTDSGMGLSPGGDGLVAPPPPPLADYGDSSPLPGTVEKTQLFYTGLEVFIQSQGLSVSRVANYGEAKGIMDDTHSPCNVIFYPSSEDHLIRVFTKEKGNTTWTTTGLLVVGKDLTYDRGCLICGDNSIELPSSAPAFAPPPPIPEGYTSHTIEGNTICLPNSPTSNDFFVYCNDSNGVLQPVLFSLKTDGSYSQSSRDKSLIDIPSIKLIYDLQSGWSYKEFGEFINLNDSTA